MNCKLIKIKNLLNKLALSTALVTLSTQVNASQSSSESIDSLIPYEGNEAVRKHFRIERGARPVFDDPSNQGKNVIELYQLMLTGFSLLEDYKRTGNFTPFKGSEFENFYTPRINHLTFQQYIDKMATYSFSDFYESLDGRPTTHANGLDFLQSLRSILVSLKVDSKIEDQQIANYFLFKSYLNQPRLNELFGIILLPEDAPYYLSIHAGIQWFDNQVVKYLIQNGSQFVRMDGDENKGSITITVPEHLNSDFPLTPIQYVRTSEAAGTFYFCYYPQYSTMQYFDERGESYSPLKKNTLVMTNHSPHYLGFILTGLEFSDTNNPESVKSGIILNKDGNIYSKNNLFFRSHDNKIIKDKYFYDHVMGQYVFHEFDITSLLTHNNDLEVSPYERLLIKLAGGVEAIKQKELVSFDEIIQEHSGETPEELAFFLSCLNYLKEEPDSSPAYSELASKFENRLLTYYDTTLSTAEVAHITAALQTQVNNETDLLVDEALEHHNPEIIQEINDYYAAKGITKVIAIPKPTSKGGTSGKKGKKAEAKNPISIAKKDLSEFKQKKAKKIVEANTKSEIQKKEQEKRANALARLRSEALRNLNGLKHLSRSELGSILDGIREKVAELDVTETGKIAIRGSHQGREVASAGGSTKLSVARRSEKDGYSVGTVKTIVKDHFDKLSKIF